MKLTKEELIQLTQDGFVDREIAEIYDMHPDSVRKKRAKFGIVKANVSERVKREWPEVIDLNTQGYNDREIAEKIQGITQGGVQKIRAKLGIPKADYGERLDKKFICKRCGKEVIIKRKEHRQWYCSECKELKSRNS
jgi:RNA polymerase-binding transcription factor DksA